jgi:hypothetical protein
MTDQPLASITTAQVVSIGATAEGNGITIENGDEVTFEYEGTYSLTFSAQITNYANSVQKAVFWVKKNGTDYPDSATEMDLQPRKDSSNPNRQVITINYVATAEADDYVQVFWAGDSTQLSVESLPAGTSPVYPAVPSIILTAVQVMYTQLGPQGASGVVSVTAPITNTGTSTSANIGIDLSNIAPIASPTFTGTATSPLLRLTATTDASPTSTGHALQIGPTDGVNLIIDGNEVMSRNNGVGSFLGLNISGGNVTIGDSESIVTIPGIIVGDSLPSGQNLIINGAFEINQRGYVSGASLASGAYGFDRWKSTFTNTTLTYTSAPQGQLVTINSGGSIEQIIERENVRAGTYTLSWQGTATGRVYNTGESAPAYAASPITLTLDGLQDVEVQFTASGGTRTLGFIQLEKGSKATAFNRNSMNLQGELAACCRYYYQKLGTDNRIRFGYQTDTNGFGQTNFVNFPTIMRIAPTMTITVTEADNFTLGATTPLDLGFTTRGVRNSSSFGYFRYSINFTATAEL